MVHVYQARKFVISIRIAHKVPTAPMTRMNMDAMVVILRVVRVLNYLYIILKYVEKLFY